MKTDKDIGFFRKQVLKLITKFQELAIKSDDRDMYLFLTKLHFRLYYKKSLVGEALKESIEFKKAAKRHANMVMVILHPTSKHKKVLHPYAKNSFQKDLLLDVKI